MISLDNSSQQEKELSLSNLTLLLTLHAYEG
jgi:hypothetical protein